MTAPPRSPPRVWIVQEWIPHYKARFFELLRERLNDAGIDMGLLTSKGSNPGIIPGQVTCAQPVRRLNLGGTIYLAIQKATEGADLVILQQAVKQLELYPLLFRYWAGRQRVALVGHGRNFQARNPNSIPARFKRVISRRVHWWFAYNDLSAAVVSDFGFPPERMTSFQNSTDTALLQSKLDALSETDIERVRAGLDIRTNNVAIFSGAMHREKRLPFLIDALIRVRQRIPDFEMIFVGAGPESHVVESAARQYRWIHFVGVKDDCDKIPYWAISKLLLMPGLVGLVVLDSFALKTPMVTTDYPYHSPEISYLSPGLNGIVVSPWDDAEVFATAVADLLKDDDKLASMADAGRVAASQYGIEKMAENFAAGVIAALNEPIKRPFG